MNWLHKTLLSPNGPNISVWTFRTLEETYIFRAIQHQKSPFSPFTKISSYIWVSVVAYLIFLAVQ